MTETSCPYHYTECGLDFVYLIGGYNFVSMQNYGECVQIINPEGLHRAIGKFLITHRKALSGKEVKFLRREMDMSQPTLAHLLGVTEQTVQKWEAGRTAQVPAPADALIRFIYSEAVGERQSGIRKRLKKIADLEDRIDDLVMSFIPPNKPTSKKQVWREIRPAKAA